MYSLDDFKCKNFHLKEISLFFINLLLSLKLQIKLDIKTQNLVVLDKGKHLNNKKGPQSRFLWGLPQSLLNTDSVVFGPIKIYLVDPSRMMNNQKVKSYFEEGKVSRSSINTVKGKECYASKSNTMSIKTQDFIQKFCYKKSASIDMTQHGFINDSKVNPVNYVIKPLKAQLEKICVKPAASKHSHCSPPQVNLHEAIKPNERQPPKSALSCPGSRSKRTGFRKVRIQCEPTPRPEEKEKKFLPESPVKKNKQKTQMSRKKKK